MCMYAFIASVLSSILLFFFSIVSFQEIFDTKFAMGENHQVIYDTDFAYHLCSRCNKNIVLVQDCVPVGNLAVMTETPDNVVIAAPENYHQLDTRTIADVRCSGCLNQLGWKCIQAVTSSPPFEEGKFGLLLKYLLLWDGKQILDAKTEQPWDGNTMEVAAPEEWNVTDDLT